MLSRAFTAESGIRLELTLFDGLQMQKAPAMIRADCMARQQLAHSFARCGPPPQNGVLVPTEQVEHVICDVVRNVVQGGKSLPQSLRIGQERMQQLFAAHGYLL